MKCYFVNNPSYLILYVVELISMSVLIRNGYGAFFNKLTVFNNTIKKESISPYGHKKLECEKAFYKFLQDNQIQFPVPKILEYGEHSYTMEYCKSHIPLYKLFHSLNYETKISVYSNIQVALHTLHKLTEQPSTYQLLENDIHYEFYSKLYERYEVVKPLLMNYSHVKSVNGVDVYSFEKSIEIHYTKVINYLKSKDIHTISLIHGDCQFNNILLEKTTQDFIFIDPKASFGTTQLFGIPEYDFAKLKFAISGYDTFDNSEITSLDIEDTNINIEYSYLLDNELANTDVLTSMVILIWLGNAHCFITQPCKAVHSYFYALYLAKIYE